jgi:hypothetical protein
MFSDTPSTSAERAVAATNLAVANVGERFQPFMLHLQDIYDPDIHPVDDIKRYVVPKEDWLVFNVPGGVILRVAHVDTEATNKSTLVPWAMINGDASQTTEQDWIFGLKGGPMIGEALLSIDYTQRPNVAKIDSTIMRPGAAYAKVFKGNAAIESLNIGVQYNSNLVITSKQVPVKLAEIIDRTNVSIMTTGSFSVTENEEALPNGERCYLAFYDEGDNFIPPAALLRVQHSSYMKDHQLGTKYLESVELLSPWFTNTMDPKLLVVPINVVIPAVELRAIAHYSDGSSSVPSPVNAPPWNLIGLSEYRPTYPGNGGELVLTRKLLDNEQHAVAEPGNPDFKKQIYRIEAGAVKGAWSPKLYTFPVWDPAISGYSLRHWLYDLDRKYVIDVTQFVTFNQQSQPWRPTAYGVSQSLVFNLNLRDVSILNASITFFQYTTIILRAPISGTGKRWEVSFAPTTPFFGGMFAQVTNAGVNTRFNVKNGFANQKAWLEGMYRAVSPSYNRWDEEKAPEPTHFYLTHPTDGRKWLFSIALWDQDNGMPIELQHGQTWVLQWVNRSSAGVELQLAASGITINAG